MNFDDARAFAAWLTAQDRAAGALSGGETYRLPIEGEWTLAAQCGDGRLYPWGASLPPAYGNYADAAAGLLFPTWVTIPGYDDGHAVACAVDASGRNSWGLYGMGGNVAEATARDGGGATFGAWRGGSWMLNAPSDLACVARVPSGGDYRGVSFGFRLVLAPAR